VLICNHAAWKTCWSFSSACKPNSDLLTFCRWVDYCEYIMLGLLLTHTHTHTHTLFFSVTTYLRHFRELIKLFHDPVTCWTQLGRATCGSYGWLMLLGLLLLLLLAVNSTVSVLNCIATRVSQILYSFSSNSIVNVDDAFSWHWSHHKLQTLQDYCCAKGKSRASGRVRAQLMLLFRIIVTLNVTGRKCVTWH